MGRKLDALFAERVLGLELLGGEGVAVVRPGPHSCGCESHLEREQLPEYTTSLDSAWEGVEKVDAEWSFHLFRVDGGDLGTGWHAELSAHQPTGLPEDEAYGGRWVVHRATDSHPALAIVLACLRAVGVGEEEIEEASGK